jgi:hypothetical protein
MPTIEIEYAVAKRSKLYLPPIDEKTGAVIRDFHGGELHFPAGIVGSQKVRYAPQECDKEPAYAYKRRPF